MRPGATNKAVDFIGTLLIAVVSFYVFVVFAMSTCSIDRCGAPKHYFDILTMFMPFLTWPAWLFRHNPRIQNIWRYVLLPLALLAVALILSRLVHWDMRVLR